MPHVADPVFSSLPEESLLFATLFGEARGEPQQGQIAVGTTIRNRVKDPHQSFGRGWSGVMLRWAAFSCLWPELGGMNYATVKAAALHMDEMRKLYKSLSHITEGIYKDIIIDPTDGATHYHEIHLTPKWTIGAMFCGQWGRHKFWRGVK